MFYQINFKMQMQYEDKKLFLKTWKKSERPTNEQEEDEFWRFQSREISLKKLIVKFKLTKKLKLFVNEEYIVLTILTF